MILNVLDVIWYILVTAGIISASLMVLGIIVLSYDMYRGWRDASPTRRHQGRHELKARIRAEKERAAHEGFFEESYVTVFDANGTMFRRLVRTPTQIAQEYYKEMDRLLDDQIFLNTEEL